MKKNHFGVKSDRRCQGCGELIKQNIIDKKPNAKHCYKCGRDETSNSTAREVKNDPSLRRRQLHRH